MKRILIAQLLFSLGCAQVQFKRGDEPVSEGRRSEYVTRGLLLGITPLQRPPDADQVCGGIANVSAVDLKMNAVDVLLTFISAGLFVQQRMEVTCR